MSTATISEDGRYRYRLTRGSELGCPSALPPAVFVMLNPSTADGLVDDPTIRRCRGFAREWGCPGLVVVNLYAYRATKPADLKWADDPVGPLNDAFLASACHKQDVICAWGQHATQERIFEVWQILYRARARTFCLGLTKDGRPRHPLFVPYDQPLVPYWSFA